MRRPPLFLLALAAFLAMARAAGGYEGPSYNSLQPEPVDIDRIARESERPDSLLDFFRKRTKLGLGFDEEYNDNVLREDNLKIDDYISTLEGLLFFADPRGTLLYGSRWEVNAFRYHKLDANAVNHDVYLFADMDSGGRLQGQLDWQIDVNNSLSFDDDTSDVARRSRDFQRQVEHEWTAKLHYALSDTNAFAPTLSYFLFDDQTVEDSATDRKILRLNLDLDHDLNRTTTLFGGYLFEDTYVPGAKSRGSEVQGGRVGLRRELSSRQKLEMSLEYKHSLYRNDRTGNSLNFLGSLRHQLTARTTVGVSYRNQEGTSFSEQRLRFRTETLVLDLHYLLTPLLALRTAASFNTRTSDESDATVAGSSNKIRDKKYTLSWGARWQVREQTHVTMQHTYTRSTTASEYTNNVVAVGFETLF